MSFHVQSASDSFKVYDSKTDSVCDNLAL